MRKVERRCSVSEMLRTEYDQIRFVRIHGGDHSVWEIRDNDANCEGQRELFGVVEWNDEWQEYGLCTTGSIMFPANILGDVREFLTSANEQAQAV
jgi:hypothetical protein